MIDGVSGAYIVTQIGPCKSCGVIQSHGIITPEKEAIVHIAGLRVVRQLLFGIMDPAGHFKQS